MRLVTYRGADGATSRLGVRVGHRVLDVEAGSRVDGEPLPASLRALLSEGRGAVSRVQALAKAAQANAGRFSASMLEERAVSYRAPVLDASRFECVRRDGEGWSSTAIDPALLLPHQAELVARAPIIVRAGVAFIIGRQTERFDPEGEAFDRVAGLTFVHEFDDGAKLAVGPELVTLDEVGDPEELWISTAVNGRELAKRGMATQATSLGDVLAVLTRTRALQPGDVVFIAPEATTEPLKLQAGDVVETSLGRQGALRTSLVSS
jgi:5-carboxymethyl-2-hydroxymuconate isomerase